MSRSIVHRVALALALVLLAPVAAAWPGSAGAAEPFRIGISLSLTGRFAESALYMKEAYELWAKELNAKGGINGRPVALTIYDDESNPDTGRVLAERLINRDNVDMILGPYSSPITDAMATVVERAEVPMLAPIASDTSIWERRRLTFSFQAFPSSTFDHEAFLGLALPRGAKRLAIVYEETPFSIGAMKWAVERVKQQPGVTIEAFGYPPGSQDFRSLIERLIAFGADAVSMGGYYAPSIALTRQMIERGFSPAAYHFIQASDGVTKNALGANVHGIFGRSAWEPVLRVGGNQEFVKAYEAAFGREPSYHSATAYAAGQVAEAALKANGSKRATLREFFATAEVPTILGTFRVDERGRQIGYRYIAIQWQGGEKVLVWPAEIAQGKPLWPKSAWK